MSLASTKHKITSYRLVSQNQALQQFDFVMPANIVIYVSCVWWMQDSCSGIYSRAAVMLDFVMLADS